MASIICPSCGTELDEKKKFCTECGIKLPTVEEQPDEIAMQATQKFEIPEENPDIAEAVRAVFQDDDEEGKPRKKNRWHDKKNKNKMKEEEEELDPNQQTIVDFSSLAGSTLDDSPYEPITAWGYIGILVLMAIPVIGWLFAIVWACGGCRKLNKRNLARGYLMILGLMGIFVLCAVLAISKIAPAILDNNPNLAASTSVDNQEPIYTVEGTKPTVNEQAQDLVEGSDSLITYLEGIGDNIWNAYYDRSLQGGQELTAILEGDRETLLSLGYSEQSVDQVLHIVNGDYEALSSLLNLIAGQQSSEE
ncbi:MAG: zinc ribbon domain-containing protein [Clostridia bacterium]|nr:zinc ribbon domain-containing protein [Clostridia bacterium]